jgi:hypothetical protein
MTEQEKELIDKIVALNCEELKSVCGEECYSQCASSIKIIVESYVKMAFWVGLQHSKRTK